MGLGQHKSTISREVNRNSGLRGYRPRQAWLLAGNLALNSLNARQISGEEWLSVEGYLREQWGPEQIVS
jgi:IS30 family transposase